MKNTILFLVVFFPLISINAQTWQQLSIPTTKHIVSSSFINDAEGWIGTTNTGGAAVIYHTADSGASWNSDIITGASGGNIFLEFVNAQIGYAVINGEAFKTTDGTTWFQLSFSGVAFYEPYFLNADTGFISGDDYMIYKTTDGGITWTASSLFVASSAYRMNFIDASHGAVCSYEGYIDGTDDGGATWYAIDDGDLWSNFYSLSYAPSGELYYTGYTDFLGDYTVVINAPYDYSSQEAGDLFDILAYDDAKIYAAGKGGQIVFTEDGSQTWHELNLCQIFNLQPGDLRVLDGFETVYVFGEGGRGFKNSAQCTLFPEFIYTINELNIHFADQTSNATYWNWDFGDGTTSTLQDPLHTYTIDGTYHACLVASNDSCESGYAGCHDIFICTSNSSQNIAGTLDTSFSGDGIASIEFDSNYNECRSLAVQPDHKVIGMNHGNGSEIIRYQINGLPDSTFDDDGIVELSSAYTGKDLKLNSSGQIIVASEDLVGTVYIHRFNTDGVIDSSFGTNGIATIDPVSGIYLESIIAMEVLPDDKVIVLTGYSYFSDEFTQIIMLNNDGSADSTFSSDGVAELASTDFYFQEGQLGSIAVQPDGKMVIAGTINSPFNKIAVARLNADGTMDATFDGDGIAETDLSPEAYVDYATDIALQPDGRIIVVGSSWESMAVVRYNTDGTLDDSFGSNGILELQPDNQDTEANAVVLQPDGKILIGGTTYFESAPYKSTIVKLNPDGSYDTSFGNNGIVRTSLNCTGALGYDLAINGDKIYVGAEGNWNIDPQFCIFRYNNEGCSVAIAGFTFEATDLTVQFTDETIVATSWQWDFGDGSTSTDQNPVHTYSLPGTYEVCLVAGNICSSDTSCQTITIIATSTDQSEITIPQFAIFPNPFTSETGIQFSLSENSPVAIELFDVHGRKIRVIAQGNFSEGNHSIFFSADDLSKGIYFVRLLTENGISNQKLIVQ